MLELDCIAISEDLLPINGFQHFNCHSQPKVSALTSALSSEVVF